MIVDTRTATVVAVCDAWKAYEASMAAETLAGDLWRKAYRDLANRERRGGFGPPDSPERIATVALELAYCAASRSKASAQALVLAKVAELAKAVAA